MILRAGASGSDVALQASVNKAFDRLARVGTRLATLVKLNNGSDDPAGLIAAEYLARDLATANRVSSSLEYSRALVHVADGAMAEASSLVTDLQSKVVAAANDTLTADQREALQEEVDATIDSIQRLGQTTFAGRALFGESLQFSVGTEPSQLESLELPALDSSLGGSTGRLADLRSGGSASLTSGNLETSASILSEVQSQLLTARATAGTFERYAIDSSQRQLQDREVNLTSALSAIRDIDFAAETSNLVREMILAESAVMTARLSMQARRTSIDLLKDVFDQRA